MKVLSNIIKNTSVGLDISPDWVRVVVLDKVINTYSVREYGKERYSIETGDDISQAIRRLYERLKISQQEVVINYRGRDIKTEIIELPIIAPSEINSRLREEVKKLFSLSVDVSSWYISYHIIQRTEEKYLLAVSFCKPESINNLVDKVEKAGLKPIMISAHILDLFLGFSLDFNDLFEKKYVFVNVEGTSIEYCLTEMGNPILMESVDTLKMLSRNIQKWQKQHSSGISRIIFTGQELKEKVLDQIEIEEVEKSIGYPLQSCGGEKLTPEYATAGGIAMKKFFPQLNTIDLLPESRQEELSKKREKNKAQKIIITAGAFLLMIVFFLQGYKFLLSDKLSALQQQKMALRESIAEVEKAEQEEQEFRQLYQHIQQLRYKKSNYSKLLYQISKNMPKSVWLYEFSTQPIPSEEENSEMERVSSITIQGLTFNEGKTAEFLQNLENLNLLTRVRLTGTKRLSAKEVWRKTKLKRIPLIQFTITAELLK